MIKVSGEHIWIIFTPTRVHTFASVSSLNNTNIIGSYNHPSKCDEESLQSSYRGEHNMKLLVGYETTSKLFFLIDLFKSP